MKRKILFVAIAAFAMLTVACSKEKTCRCAVLHSSKVRVIKIDAGNCEDLRTYSYHDALDQLVVDSLLCTDYEFDADSVYNK